MNMTSELKPCPLCGNKKIVFSTLCEEEMCRHFEDEECPCYEAEERNANDCYAHFVVCPINEGGCGCSTGWYANQEKAAAAWNRRADT